MRCVHANQEAEADPPGLGGARGCSPSGPPIHPPSTACQMDTCHQHCILQADHLGNATFQSSSTAVPWPHGKQDGCALLRGASNP